MDSETQTLLVRLTGLLRAEAPGTAFAEALDVLAAAGLERPSQPLPEGARPWLSLDAHGTQLVLRATAPSAPSADLAPVVCSLLEALLERAEVDDTRRRERERLQMLSSASFEGIFVHVDGTLIDCNERCLEMLRCSREHFLAPGTLQRVVIPEDLPKILTRMQTGSEEPYTVTAVRADGTRFLAEIQAKQGRLGERPIRVAAVRDVTEREHRARLMEESEARLRGLAEAMFDCFVHSVDGRIVDVGGDVDRVTGYTRDELVGADVLDFVAPPGRDKARRMIETQSTDAYESLLLRKDGTTLPVELIGTPATYGGRPARFAGLRDRSEARRVERERQELQARVERGQRMEALGVLAGGIAHDFNNLLLGVLGHAELLELSLGTAGPHAQSLEAIKTTAERAATLTRQLLAYAGRGGGGPRWEPVDMGGVLRELEVLLAPGLPRGTRLRVHIEDDCLVRGDPTTLRQVMLNLLTNASDALPGGEGEIEVRVERVRDPAVEWADAMGAQVGPGNWVCIHVRDSGIGMDPHAQARVFEPFYTTKSKGHGLGLAACLGILQAHHGAIRVDSKVGRGSCFSVLIPADEGSAVEVDEAAGGVPVNPCSVLVIDDEEVVRDQVMRLLSLRGFTVHGAADGESGLEAAGRLAPELIVLDVAMPGMDGVEVARRLRRMGSTVPILLSTGYLDQDAVAELDDALVQGMLMKPYSSTDLLRAIASARGVGQSAMPARGAAREPGVTT